MKLLLFVVLMCPLFADAQVSGVQAGATVLFYKHGGFGYGGQLIAKAGISRTVSLGAGISAVLFKDEKTAYLPVYAALALHLPVRTFLLTADIHLGKGIYKQPETTGGFYWSSGVTIAPLKPATLYFSAHFTTYEYQKTIMLPYTAIKQNNLIEALTLSAGVWLKTAHHQKNH